MIDWAKRKALVRDLTARIARFDNMTLAAEYVKADRGADWGDPESLLWLAYLAAERANRIEDPNRGPAA